MENVKRKKREAQVPITAAMAVSLKIIPIIQIIQGFFHGYTQIK